MLILQMIKGLELRDFSGFGTGILGGSCRVSSNTTTVVKHMALI